MITKFTVANFLSFQEPAILSFAVKKTEKNHPDSTFCPIKKSNAKFVKSIAIYGANASGKSNLLKSLEFFRYFTTEFRSHSEESIKIPQIVEFLLNEETRNKPSFFEIEIIIADELYIYGFKVSRERVAEEWLHKKKGKKNFFTRKKQKIELARDFEKHGKDLIKKTREDALFLNILAEFNVEIARKVKEIIARIIIFTNNNDNDDPRAYDKAVKSYCDSDNYRKIVNELIYEADFGIKEIRANYKYLPLNELQDMTLKNTPENLKKPLEEFFQNLENASDKLVKDLGKKGKKNSRSNLVLDYQIYSIHNLFNKKGEIVNEVAFEFLEAESQGTKKMFIMASLFAKILSDGGLLIIDEIDSAMHPLLCQFIVSKFNSYKGNKKDKQKNPCQLLFTTHDTNIINQDILRKDQICFVEKNQFEASELFSLADIGERDGVSYSKRYLEGRYGAIPNINSGN